MCTFPAYYCYGARTCVRFPMLASVLQAASPTDTFRLIPDALGCSLIHRWRLAHALPRVKTTAKSQPWHFHRVSGADQKQSKALPDPPHASFMRPIRFAAQKLDRASGMDTLDLPAAYVVVQASVAAARASFELLYALDTSPFIAPLLRVPNCGP